MSARTILGLIFIMMISTAVSAQWKDKSWPTKAARTSPVTTTAPQVTAESQDRSWSAKAARTDKVAASMLLQAAANKSANTRADDDDGEAVLEDTWRATETFGDGSVFRILFTFGAGKNGSNGVVTHSDELFLVAPVSCLTAQGVWKKTGRRNYNVTDEGFCFATNNGFLPAGKVQFKSAIKLNRRGTEFSGNMHIDGFDLDPTTGDLVLVFSTDATLHGERMPVEAP